MSDSSARIGVNEGLFREVNESIEQLHEELGPATAFEIVCECGRADCTERFSITVGEYRSVREDDRQFAVVPGHEKPEVERIVERHEGYLVVEKTDPDAAEAAEETA